MHRAFLSGRDVGLVAAGMARGVCMGPNPVLLSQLLQVLGHTGQPPAPGLLWFCCCLSTRQLIAASAPAGPGRLGTQQKWAAGTFPVCPAAWSKMFCLLPYHCGLKRWLHHGLQLRGEPHAIALSWPLSSPFLPRLAWVRDQRSLLAPVGKPSP